MQSSGSNIENAEFKALNDWLMNLENLKYVDPCKKQIIESGSNDIDQNKITKAKVFDGPFPCENMNKTEFVKIKGNIDNDGVLHGKVKIFHMKKKNNFVTSIDKIIISIAFLNIFLKFDFSKRKNQLHSELFQRFDNNRFSSLSLAHKICIAQNPQSKIKIHF